MITITNFDDLLSEINKIYRSKLYLIAIDGRGGAGKSTLAKEIKHSIKSVQIVSIDSFPCTKNEYPFHSSGTQTRISTERICKEVIQPLLQNKTSYYTNSNWWINDNKQANYTVIPKDIVIFEGCYSLHKKLRDYFDLKIWIEISRKNAIERAVQRDGTKSLIHWEEVYSVNEDNYIKMQNPRDIADIIYNVNL